MKLWTFENRKFCMTMSTVLEYKAGCTCTSIGKSNTNNLPARKNFDSTQKSASVVALLVEIALEVQPWRPIFEKCSHLREKGGVLTQIRA
jgi:hypothetical protein